MVFNASFETALDKATSSKNLCRLPAVAQNYIVPMIVDRLSVSILAAARRHDKEEA